jgi:hypothetical protein
MISVLGSVGLIEISGDVSSWDMYCLDLEIPTHLKVSFLFCCWCLSYLIYLRGLFLYQGLVPHKTAVAISFGLTCKHLNLQCMSIPVHLWCHPTISASLMLRTHLEIIALVLPMSSPVPLNPTGAYLVVTRCWLSWQCYYMYSHRLQYLMACYILSDLKFWYLLSPIYSGFPCS